MTSLDEAHAAIRAYSTTWYEPVIGLPARLNEAASAAYLLMRGIDEIEDHPGLDVATKTGLLRAVGQVLQTRFTGVDFDALFGGHRAALPDVTLRLGEWAVLAPPEIAPRVTETFATMAERMADWAEHGWRIRTEADLDQYTYAVGGTLVLLLSDLWSWYDGTWADRALGVSYGRALQAVNIYSDRHADLGRGVDFWPEGWDAHQLAGYAQRELHRADQYLARLSGPAHRFCARPLQAAWRAIRQQETG